MCVEREKGGSAGTLSGVPKATRPKKVPPVKRKAEGNRVVRKIGQTPAPAWVKSPAFSRRGRVVTKLPISGSRGEEKKGADGTEENYSVSTSSNALWRPVCQNRTRKKNLQKWETP